MRASSLLPWGAVLIAGTPLFAQNTNPRAEAAAAYDQILAGLAPGATLVELGDMFVPVEVVRAWRDQFASTGGGTSLATQVGVNKWTGGNVFYQFNANVTPAHRTHFRDAAAEWASFANLTFTEGAGSGNYIMVNDVPGLEGGNSAVGMIGGAQALNIGSTSWNRPTLCHEIGHALGFIHEHQRNDRDTYVTINFSNVPGGASNGNFTLIPTSTNQNAYDFFSIMHYGRKTLAVNPAIDTITPKPTYLQFIDIMGGGYRDRVLSRGDRDGAALMYGAGPAISTMVTNTKDSGPGSLRTAIYRAFDTVTDTPGATPTISFNIPNTDPNFAGGVFTIAPTDRLPAPGPRTTIAGETQTAFGGNTNASGPEVVLNGAAQSADPSTFGRGVFLAEASVTVRGLVINGFSTQGVYISGPDATGCTVAGCYIGTNAAGTAAVPNSLEGIEINGGATANRIGGTTAAARNVISGNVYQGIFIKDAGTSGNVVEGNYIGINAAGTAAVANGTNSHFAGVEIGAGASGNTVGGSAAGAGNVLSGNTAQGVAIIGGNNNAVLGNLVGTNAAGTGAVPNQFAGVQIFGGGKFNTIGGTTPAARNVLSGNLNQGAAISGAGTSNNTILGNYAGLNAAGTAALPNTYAGVEIFGGATNNTIGGTAAGAANVLSGNLGQGVALSQAGTSGNVVAGNLIGTNPAGTAAIGNGTPSVRYSGVGLFSGASSNTIGGTALGAGNVISGNTGQGILFYDAATTSNVVAGNWIGLNLAGTAAIANGWSGIEIAGSAQGNTIGGTSAGARNVISGNTLQGVYINGASTGSNRVLGNYIGTNPAGTAGFAGGGPGVQIWGGAQGNTIGGTSGGRNFICGNAGSGLTISGIGTSANSVLGNSIGTTPAGTTVANTNEGIALFADFSGAPTGNMIGGSAPGAANLIAGNAGPGVAIYNNGTTGNRISGNSINANGGLGIDLWNDAISPNDAGDGDSGPNNLQNFPVLSSAVLGTSTTVNGSLNSTASTTFRIEFFANAAADASGNGEGQHFVGSANVTTNASGNATIAAVLPAIVPAGQRISATATDPAGNTSEFSANVIVSTTDTDGDGLPNAYETANGLSTSLNDANLDSDGDGSTNAQEFRAGTDPRNPASALRLPAPTLAGADIAQGLPTMLGRTYRLDFADALGSPTAWRIFADQIPGNGSTITLTDPGAASLPQRFYRAVVEP